LKFKRLDIDDVILITPDVFKDNRGYFYESYSQEKIDKGLELSVKFVQDNLSYSSKKNTIRGVHYQLNNPQGKLMSCTRGAILDVAVDIREGSKTFGKWVSAILSDDNHNRLWIPRGFAHGFRTLTDDCVVSYKLDEFYYHDSKCGFMWNDTNVNIDWGLSGTDEVILSDQDKDYDSFDQLEKL